MSNPETLTDAVHATTTRRILRTWAFSSEEDELATLKVYRRLTTESDPVWSEVRTELQAWAQQVRLQETWEEQYPPWRTHSTIGGWQTAYSRAQLHLYRARKIILEIVSE